MPLAAALESAGRPAAYGLKVATALSVSPALSARNDPRPVTAKASPAAGSSPPAAMPIRQSEGPTRIEKSNRAMTAQERAAIDYRQAVALLNEGRQGAAMESLRAVLRSDASHAEARLLLSTLLLERRQLEEAKAILVEGLAIEPAQPRLAMPLARIHVELGDAGAAAETLSRAAQAATGNAEYRGFYAAVLQRLGRHKEAAAEFQAALRLLPESGLWWMGLGISLEADGQRGAAKDALRRARETRRLTPELDRYVEQKLQALP
jgi:MSHA biogenesis protein MshN